MSGDSLDDVGPFDVLLPLMHGVGYGLIGANFVNFLEFFDMGLGLAMLCGSIFVEPRLEDLPRGRQGDLARYRRGRDAHAPIRPGRSHGGRLPRRTLRDRALDHALDDARAVPDVLHVLGEAPWLQ